MKILIAFFSMGGRTRKAAKAIAAELHDDDVDIEEMTFRGKMPELGQEMQSIMKGDLSRFSFDQKILDLSNYDRIIFGAPTYGAAPASPFYAFLENCKNGTGKEWVVFATCATTGGKVIDKMKEAIEKKGGTVAGECLFKTLFGVNLKKVGAFAHACSH